jgi:hypothetical protein
VLIETLTTGRYGVPSPGGISIEIHEGYSKAYSIGRSLRDVPALLASEPSFRAAMTSAIDEQLKRDLAQVPGATNCVVVGPGGACRPEAASDQQKEGFRRAAEQTHADRLAKAGERAPRLLKALQELYPFADASCRLNFE